MSNSLVAIVCLNICSISCRFNSNIYIEGMAGNTESFPIFAKPSENIKHNVVGEGVFVVLFTISLK